VHILRLWKVPAAQSTLQLVIRKRFKLATRANLGALDALASKHAFLFDRSNRGAELLADSSLGRVDQRFTRSLLEWSCRSLPRGTKSAGY
jgi:hypothetical protein